MSKASREERKAAHARLERISREEALRRERDEARAEAAEWRQRAEVAEAESELLSRVLLPSTCRPGDDVNPDGTVHQDDP